METSRNQLYFNRPTPGTYSPLVNQCNMFSTQSSNSAKANMEKMYSSKQDLNLQVPTPNPSTPKRGNIFQNMYNSLATIFVDQLAKVPTTLINHLTNVNNTLSVTIVPNEGIISQEFFKTLTGNKDHLSQNMYMQCKEPSVDFVDRIKTSNKGYIPKDDFFGSTNDSKFTNLDDFDLCLDLEPMFLYEKAFDNNQILNQTEKQIDLGNCKLGLDTTINKIIPEEEIISKKETNSQTMMLSEDKINSQQEAEDRLISEENRQNSGLKLASEAEKLNSPSNPFLNMWNKIVSDVSDSFRSVSPVSKPCLKNYQTAKCRRKIKCVSNRRGRGRGRSQLRRNGVSQSRHRKERSKHQLCSDIQDDFDTWEEFEAYSEPFNCLGQEENLDSTMDTLDPSSGYSLSFELIDIKPKKIKQKKSTHVKPENFSMKIKFVPECSLEKRELNCIIDKTIFRPRLISEASIDSEDSYIVFETGTQSDFDDSDCSDETSDSDSDTESETDDEPAKHKVRFNLKPTIHKMVKWDFAYRAARPGPWEEIARDRERFKDRINSIGRILEPVLSPHIRSKIWNERFAVGESL